MLHLETRTLLNALWNGLSPISKWIKTLKLRILAVVLGYIQPGWQNEAQLLPALISQIIPCSMQNR